MAADLWLYLEACCVASGWSQLPSAPASCSSTSVWASSQVRRKRLLSTRTWGFLLLAWAPTLGHLSQTQWEPGEIKSWWDRGPRLSAAPDELQQKAYPLLSAVFLAEHRVRALSRGCAFYRWVLSARGDGEDGRQCPQLPLKRTQVDCALPWARQALQDTSATMKKAPVFLCYCALSSLYEIYEMRLQGFALVYLPFACLWG